MTYTVATTATAIGPGAMKSVSVGGQSILLANVGGRFYAMQQKCPHMGADLCAGTLAGSTVTCPRHHASFDVTSGEAVDRAKILFMKMPTKNARVFPVRVEGDQVLVDVA